MKTSKGYVRDTFMSVKSKAVAFFFSFIVACAPQSAVTGTDVSEPVGKQTETQAKKEQSKVNSTIVVNDYLLFLQARRDKDMPRAIVHLKRALDKDENNGALEKELFSALAQEGRLKEAFPLAQKELKRHPDSLLAMLVVVANHTKNADYESALRVLDDFADEESKAFLVPLFKSWQYVGLNEKEKAKNSLTVLDTKGTAALYSFHLALMNDIWGNEEETEKHYARLMKKNDGFSLRAAQTYGNFLLRAENYERFNVLLEAYRQGNRSFPLLDEDFFLAGAKKIGKDIPAVVPTAKEGLAEAFFDVAGSLSEKGNTESAYYFTQISLFLDDKLALARVLKGSLLESMERENAAQALYSSETSGSETYFSSQVSLARLLAKQKKFDEAEKVLKKLAGKKSESYLPFMELGDVYMRSEKFSKAINAYTQALEKAPQTKQLGWAIYYSRGTAYERNNQWDLAEKDFLNALLLNPDQPLALNYLGYSWLERGKNIPQAKEMLERALLKSPHDGFIADSLGWAYYMTKEFNKAVTVLELAVALDPASAVINDHLGDAYWRTGRKREARFQWEKSLDLNDDFSGNDRDRVRLKIEQGLDKVGDKIPLAAVQPVKTAKKNTKKK